MDLSPTRVTRALPAIAAVAGTLAALLVAILPEWRLVALVEGLKLPSLLAAATPPLGLKARMGLAVIAGGLAGGGVFAAGRLALRLLPGVGEDGVPVLRRADAHPDHPARRPIRAMEDLGAPLPDEAPSLRPMRAGESDGAPRPMRAATILVPAPAPAVDRTLPSDLDTPLAALDPAAIPMAPREPVRPVAPLAKPAPAVEEAFELVPIRRARAKPTPEPRPTTIAGLIERLEREAARGAKPRPSAEGLGALGGLARG